MNTDLQQIPLFNTTTHLQFVESLLQTDLDFKSADGQYASHNYHSFPAKFPPQLPAKFIRALTSPGDAVLDPMMGSATTLVEARLVMRRAAGFDIDPLAVRLARVKTTSYDGALLESRISEILSRAAHAFRVEQNRLATTLDSKWNEKTRRFIEYWFAPTTQLELLALAEQIERLENDSVRTFFEVALSSTIIAKSGGVSLAIDLAHTRPHRAKIVYNENGDVLIGANLLDDDSPRLKILTKRLRSAFEVFELRAKKNLTTLPPARPNMMQSQVGYGNAQAMPLGANTIDLIVTSPPYAANAIDYMRAHKFSLVWLGYNVDSLTKTRGEYIGGEATLDRDYVRLPVATAKVVDLVTSKDARKGKVLHRYYSEMTRVLAEMCRVLKPGKAAIVVVGSSTMRGVDTHTGECLAEIGQSIGFVIPRIGVRIIDRDRRMMPTSANGNPDSQIQQRMTEEYVLGFVKPR